MSWEKRLMVALDIPDASRALDIVKKLNGHAEIFKIGLELFSSVGPQIVEAIQRKGKKVFLDLKFHDIPNTASNASAVAARLGVFMFNVHTFGGFEMMKRCSDSASETSIKEGLQRPKIVGVTVLTSLTIKELKGEIGIHRDVKDQVRHLASMAQKAGLDGVVASAHEVSEIKRLCGNNFLTVVPGIRSSCFPTDDQKRRATISETLREGADYIVMGRSLLKQEDPVRAIELISDELKSEQKGLFKCN
ncbi:orotidine-5'-phosphate decarboxylase [Thermodesulfovibrionales bacterium]|nr:orotidine-5'-phosphate decarboxylase [Thermodesulfovibrionales bacterium]